jgi:hypothetical protein
MKRFEQHGHGLRRQDTEHPHRIELFPPQAATSGCRSVWFISFALLPTLSIHCVLGASLQLAPPLLPVEQACPLAIPLIFTQDGNSASGIQFDLIYDTTTVDIAFTVSKSTSQSAKRVYTSDLAASGTRFLVIGLNDDPIPDGVLIHLQVSLKNSSDAQFLMFSLSHGVATDRDSHAVPLFLLITAPSTIESTGPSFATPRNFCHGASRNSTLLRTYRW